MPKKGKPKSFDELKSPESKTSGVKRIIREGFDDSQWSKSKKKRMRKLLAKQRKTATSSDTLLKQKDLEPMATVATEKSAKSTDRATKLKKHLSIPSKLQQRFQERLSGSKFRILNEELYTTASTTSFDKFQNDASLFEIYHEGFRHQVESWPQNPVNVLLEKIRKHAQRQHSTKLVVADFGCGEAELAKKLIEDESMFRVHSFDLVAGGPNANLITACDIAKTPLENSSVDVGVFCLSLMGTNLADFVREAHRVLKLDGTLHIAEVRSRFESKNKSEALDNFIEVLGSLGFDCKNIDRSNTMFVLLELEKNGRVPDSNLVFTAKPCVYKRR